MCSQHQRGEKRCHCGILITRSHNVNTGGSLFFIHVLVLNIFRVILHVLRYHRHGFLKQNLSKIAWSRPGEYPAVNEWWWKMVNECYSCSITLYPIFNQQHTKLDIQWTVVFVHTITNHHSENIGCWCQRVYNPTDLIQKNVIYVLFCILSTCMF